jgi:hypothetical protein
MTQTKLQKCFEFGILILEFVCCLMLVFWNLIIYKKNHNMTKHQIRRRFRNVYLMLYHSLSHNRGENSG